MLTFTEKKNLLKWLYESNFDYNLMYNVCLKVNEIPIVWVSNFNQVVNIYLYIKAKKVY
jgi:hypothetical protein